MAAKKQKFKCIYCEEIFDDEAEYYEHRDDILCMCAICGKVFKDFYRHLSEHYNDGLFKCFMCRVTTKDGISMTNHITLHQIKIFECKECNAGFCLKNRLIDHVKKHLWECDKCNFEAKTLKDLDEHKKCHEKENSDRFYSAHEFIPNGLQLKDRFTNETIFISK